MKFRNKPVVIEAVQFLATKASFDAIMAMGSISWSPREMGSETFIVTTLEGDLLVRKGDWVIRGVQGEFYLCKPDIFEATYESAENVSDNESGQGSKLSKTKTTSDYMGAGSSAPSIGDDDILSPWHTVSPSAIGDDDILSLWYTVRPSAKQDKVMTCDSGPYGVTFPSFELRRLVELAIVYGQKGKAG